MRKDTAIVWFRQDLRLHDNEALWEASQAAERVVPVYVFDERVFMNKTKFGFPKTNVHRAQFIIESVANLRKSLKKRGANLIVRIGNSEDILCELCENYNASWIYCNRERTQEEVDVQNALEKKLWQRGLELRYTRGKMLYYTSDLPFPISQTPDVFTNFRKEVEKIISVREPLASESLNFFPFNPHTDFGKIPSIKDFGLRFKKFQKSNFKGGESEGLARLRYYLWESDLIKEYKNSRNGLLGKDYSSKFSPYLSQGCLSPKTIYAEIKKYEEERGANESTYWLTFELLWRDFFRLMGKKHGNKIFQLNGISENEKDWSENMENFLKWANGQTGIPFVDANMKEINTTGFMSNRGRQITASFLINDLGLNWLMGAEYFESLLIDYDPCSNYGNWGYIAGVGNDPRKDRYFNILSQAKRYDPQGEYIKKWIPKLADLEQPDIFLPELTNSEVLAKNGIKLGEMYPHAMVNVEKWIN